MTEIMEWTVLGDIPSQANQKYFLRDGRCIYIPPKGTVSVKHYRRQFALQTPAKYKKNSISKFIVGLIIYRKDRRKDPHNLPKVIFDAIEDAGVVKNDNQIVKGYWDGDDIDKDNPRVEIKLWEIGGGKK